MDDGPHRVRLAPEARPQREADSGSRGASPAGPGGILGLQQAAGNRAVQRLLQREAEATGGEQLSSRERAERYILDLIKRYDGYITRTFENLEGALLPPHLVDLVRGFKVVHQATRVLTPEMIQQLQSAVQREKVDDYADRLFTRLRSDVSFKQEMVDALDGDPWRWYMDYQDRLINASRIGL